MDSKCVNLVNELCNRIKKLENMKYNKTEIFQYITESVSDELEIVANGEMIIYQIINSIQIFERDIETKMGQKILNIIVSGSFILDIEDDNNIEPITGTIIVRIKINDLILTEQETGISNTSFSNISLNYNLPIDENLIYTITIEYEGSAISSEMIMGTIRLNSRKDGISISILVV